MDNSNIKDILVGLGYNLKEMGGEQWSTRPLYRDSDNNFAVSINKKTGQFYDFVTKNGGCFEKLIHLTTGKPLDKELRDKLLNNVFYDEKEEIKLSITKKFDKSILLKLEKDNSYWNSRGISDYVLDKFQGGVSRSGKMFNRFVFPVYNSRDDLVGFSGRYLYNSDYVPKYKHIGTKSNWIYPAFLSGPEIKKSKEVILVEGISDALFLFEQGITNVLATFGVNISPKIIEYLLKVDVNRIIIAFNNDSDNNYVGNDAAVKEKKKLLNYFDESQIIIALPNKKDFGEMDNKEILDWRNSL
jgi:5S rRNA maturation endonuclease (ribonuclease M5)